MKPRNREVNIFNMSVLDLLTGALGAFCFLTLALFPYYFKAQNAAAAGSGGGTANASLKAHNESLKAQIAAERAAGNQMPPFALLQLSSVNAQRTAACATLVLKSAIQPPGAPPVGYRLTSAQPDGSAYGIYLFAIRPGPYHFVASATLIAPGTCTISIATANTIQRSQQLTITQTQDVQLDFNVESGDFSASLFD